MADAVLADEVRQVREASRLMLRELGFLQPDVQGLSPSQCQALLELGARGPASGAQLAALLVLDKSTTSRTLAPLVERALVRVTVPSGDRRTRVYDLTARGRACLARLHEGTDARVQDALALLTAEERAAAVRGLALYTRALGRARQRQGITVRPIRKADNAAVARVIRTVMPEFGACGAGFSILDPEVDDMAGAYRGRAAYFVAVRGRTVLGGAGVGPLAGAPDHVCELKKMYLLPPARGLGIGQALLDAALAAARRFGYRRCYLETLGSMAQAARLYERNGFTRRKGPLGRTGHFGCDTFYERRL